MSDDNTPVRMKEMCLNSFHADPQTVCVTVVLFCTLIQKQLSENVFIDERRPVLLCDGKLCLRVLQDLFNLTVVEMMYGT